MAYLWIVVVHCLLVVISMYAVAASRMTARSVFLRLGFLGFVLFACTELLRTSLAIFALNRSWREGYAAAADDAARERFRVMIQGFSGVNDALFFLFFIGFFIGVLCYGLELRRAPGRDGLVGWLFLVWAFLSLPTLIDTVGGTERFAPYFAWVGPGFQPAARALIGLWLWKSSRIGEPFERVHQQ